MRGRNPAVLILLLFCLIELFKSVPPHPDKQASLTVDVYRSALYHVFMIRNFKCKQTQALYEGGSPKQFRSFQAQAERKLQMLDNAVDLKDLRSPPGNMLEKLSGDRSGQYSIRINKQWRICFVWLDEPTEVEIIDYH